MTQSLFPLDYDIDEDHDVALANVLGVADDVCLAPLVGRRQSIVRATPGVRRRRRLVD